MSRDHFDPQEWGRALDSGQRTSDELKLAAELEKERYDRVGSPPAFKQELRQRLLAQYDHRPGLAERFGRALTTAGAVTVLAALVFLFYAWVSQGTLSPSAGPAAQSEPTEAPTASSTPLPVELEAVAGEASPAPLVPTVTPYFGLPLVLERVVVAPDTPRPGETINVTLFWRAWSDVAAYNVFVQLSDEAGGLVAQSDAPLAVAGDGSGPVEQSHSLALARTAAPGRYWLTLGMIDPASGARQQIYSSVGTADTMSLGSVEVAAEGDRLWLISVSPEPGILLGGGTTIHVEVGYELASAAEGLLRLSLAAPGWENSTGPQLPVEGLGQAVAVTGGIGSVTFDYTVESSDYLPVLLGPSATLMAELGTLSGDRLDVWLQRTFSDYQWPTGRQTATPFPQLLATPSPMPYIPPEP
jgi:hypothetical protein